MARGRCAGCGREDPSSKVIERHAPKCPEFLALYREAPERALDPVPEMERYAAWKLTDEYVEAREDRRTEIISGFTERNDQRIKTQEARWASRKFVSGRATSRAVPAPENGRLGVGPVSEGVAKRIMVEVQGPSADAGRRVADRVDQLRDGTG